MDVIESGKTVLHRGREAPEILEEETAELVVERWRIPSPVVREQLITKGAYLPRAEAQLRAQTRARRVAQGGGRTRGGAEPAVMRAVLHDETRWRSRVALEGCSTKQYVRPK